MVEILFNILLLKMLNIDLIIAMISLLVGVVATYFTYKINKKIDNFDNYQYEFAKNLLKESLITYKNWCKEYIKNINNNRYSIRNVLFPTEIFQSIIIANTQIDKFFELKQEFLAIIMQINTINSLHLEIKSFGNNERLEFGTGYKDIQKKQLIDDIQSLEKAIAEFQEKFLE
jgi:hypothetical protein